MSMRRANHTSGWVLAEAVKLALRLVDDNFGFNKLLGMGRQRWAVRTLASRGETAKLIAWYSQ